MLQILLAEDNPALAQSLQRSLERRGFQLRVCADGPSALATWLNLPPDVVVLDLSLPGLDGLDVLQQARQQGRRTPVLILTARGTVGDRILGLNLGADDYLAKPFDLDELEARIRALGRRHGVVVTATPSASPERFCGLSLDPDTPAVLFSDEVHGTAQPLNLSQRELALLRALLAKPGQAVAKERLFIQVFPDETEARFDAIEVVAYRLRKKLSAVPVELVTLRGLGYLLRARRAHSSEGE